MLPAGCGKTQIVATIAADLAERSQRVLLLTHTHAGVDALRRRLARLGVPRSAVELCTIASWTARLASSFPCTSRIKGLQEPTWPDLCDGAARALDNRHIARMLACSYDLIVVDEYQDCTQAQHRVVLALNDVRPVIVFGDPLQAIYDFGDEELVDMTRDLDSLSPASVPCIPWRWRDTNPALGAYLLGLREALLVGGFVDLQDAALTWVENTPEKRRKAMWRQVGASGSSVILTRFDAQCEAIAKGLSGNFQVVEDIDGRRLLPLVRAIGRETGVPAAGELLVLAKSSMTKLPPSLTNKIPSLRAGMFPMFQASSGSAHALAALQDFAEAQDAPTLLRAIDEIDALGGTLCRQEIWGDLRQAAAAWKDSEGSLSAAVQLTRNKMRRRGRWPPTRSVSRPVLAKGQEFDHCVISDAEAMNARELYVAMTRGRASLTVMAAEPWLHPRL